MRKLSIVYRLLETTMQKWRKRYTDCRIFGLQVTRHDLTKACPVALSGGMWPNSQINVPEPKCQLIDLILEMARYLVCHYRYFILIRINIYESINSQMKFKKPPIFGSYTCFLSTQPPTLNPPHPHPLDAYNWHYSRCVNYICLILSLCHIMTWIIDILRHNPTDREYPSSVTFSITHLTCIRPAQRVCDKSREVSKLWYLG